MTGCWSPLSFRRHRQAWAIWGVLRQSPMIKCVNAERRVTYGVHSQLQRRAFSSGHHGQNNQQDQHSLTTESRVADNDDLNAVDHSTQGGELDDRGGLRKPGWPWISVIPPETMHFAKGGSRQRCKQIDIAEQDGKTLGALTKRSKDIKFPKASNDRHVQSVLSFSITESICNLLGKHGWSGHTVLELRTYLADGLILHPRQAYEVLSRQRDAGVAHSFLLWALDEGRCKVQTKCFTVVLLLLGRVKRFDLLELLLEDVVRRGYKTDKILLTAAMRSYAEGQKRKEAMDIFVKMKALGYKPDCVTYTVLVQMFSRAKLYQEALKLFDEMLAQEVATDTQFYNCVVSTLGKAGRMDLAYSKLEEMRGRGHVPDQFTYGVLIVGYVRAGRQEYMDLYKEMQEVGVPLNEVIFNMMFSGVERAGSLKDAESLIADMERVGLPTNLVAFSTLIGMCATRGDADGAQRWFNKMLNTGLHPTIGIGNSLLDGHSKAGRFDQAKLVLDSFQVWGLVPNLTTLSVCLRCLGMCETSKDLKVVQEMLSCHAGSKFVSTLLKERVERNLNQHIVLFLGGLHHETKKSRRDFVNVLIDYLYRNGFYNQAFALWEGATASYVFPALVEQGPEGICSINLGGMDCGTAIVALSQTLPRLAKQFHRQEMTPAWVQICTDQATDHTTSTNPHSVHRFVESFLSDLRSPFESGTPETGGGFVSRGEQVMHWIDQPKIQDLLAYNRRV